MPDQCSKVLAFKPQLLYKFGFYAVTLISLPAPLHSEFWAGIPEFCQVSRFPDMRCPGNDGETLTVRLRLAFVGAFDYMALTDLSSFHFLSCGRFPDVLVRRVVNRFVDWAKTGTRSGLPDDVDHIFYVFL